MSEEGEILCLGAVRLSLYQCPAPSTAVSGSNSTCPTMKTHRGDVLIPFYKSSTTYKDLKEGVEFRLNQYSVLHIAPDPGDSDGGAQRRQPPIHTEASMKNAPCCFTGSYLCPRCSGDETLTMNDLSPSRKRKRGAGGVEYPRITVRHFTRAQSSTSDTASPLHKAVDFSALVTEDDLGCFFYCTMEHSPAEFAPLSPASRQVVGRDHVREYASDSAYDDVSPRRIELKLGERLLRVGVSAGQRFTDVFERLRRRHLHVHRLFDGATGASILPCELVRHLSWRVAALCADVDMDTNALLPAHSAAPGHGVPSLISLSEASELFGNGNGNSWGIGLDSSASGTSSGRRRERLLWQRSFGFGDESEDTVVVNLLSPPRRVPRSGSGSDTVAATQEIAAGDTPFRAVYLDEEPCGDGASITPMRGDGAETRPWWAGGAEELPIMVTQQALPDFYGDEEEEERDEVDEGGDEISFD